MPFRSTLSLSKASEQNPAISSIQESSYRRSQDAEMQQKNAKLKKMIHDRLSLNGWSASMPDLVANEAPQRRNYRSSPPEAPARRKVKGSRSTSSESDSAPTSIHFSVSELNVEDAGAWKAKREVKMQSSSGGRREIGRDSVAIDAETFQYSAEMDHEMVRDDESGMDDLRAFGSSEPSVRRQMNDSRVFERDLEDDLESLEASTAIESAPKLRFKAPADMNSPMEAAEGPSIQFTPKNVSQRSSTDDYETPVGTSDKAVPSVKLSNLPPDVLEEIMRPTIPGFHSKDSRDNLRAFESSTGNFSAPASPTDDYKVAAVEKMAPGNNYEAAEGPSSLVAKKAKKMAPSINFEGLDSSNPLINHFESSMDEFGASRSPGVSEIVSKSLLDEFRASTSPKTDSDSLTDDFRASTSQEASGIDSDSLVDDFRAFKITEQPAGDLKSDFDDTDSPMEAPEQPPISSRAQNLKQELLKSHSSPELYQITPAMRSLIISENISALIDPDGRRKLTDSRKSSSNSDLSVQPMKLQPSSDSRLIADELQRRINEERPVEVPVPPARTSKRKTSPPAIKPRKKLTNDSCDECGEPNCELAQRPNDAGQLKSILKSTDNPTDSPRQLQLRFTEPKPIHDDIFVSDTDSYDEAIGFLAQPGERDTWDLLDEHRDSLNIMGKQKSPHSTEKGS